MKVKKSITIEEDFVYEMLALDENFSKALDKTLRLSKSYSETLADIQTLLEDDEIPVTKKIVRISQMIESNGKLITMLLKN